MPTLAPAQTPTANSGTPTAICATGCTNAQQNGAASMGAGNLNGSLPNPPGTGTPTGTVDGTGGADTSGAGTGMTAPGSPPAPATPSTGG
ncbi:hypothetical protein SAMN05216548_11197 [Faunimonas pinastri]|uniref:Uncharacterized protein n=1 Tax=Faunimonas pinastri TaxID=1855383 RepID=A0A1H9LIB3_9HYPH|nr:hypothetical protein SAMN05216548_11197 [Faunimonas pinastri]